MRQVLLAVCAAGLVLAPAYADEEKERERARERRSEDAAAVEAPGEAREPGGRSAEMPEGLAKRESPPPGIERRVEKKGELPPGLGKRFEPMVRRGVGAPGAPGGAGPGGGPGRGRGRK